MATVNSENQMRSNYLDVKDLESKNPSELAAIVKELKRQDYKGNAELIRKVCDIIDQKTAHYSRVEVVRNPVTTDHYTRVHIVEKPVIFYKAANADVTKRKAQSCCCAITLGP